MTILQQFAMAMAEWEAGTGLFGRGYKIQGRKPYLDYLDNASWRKLKDSMSQEHRQQFEGGGGKELEEKGGCPPKMAAFASSSRMVYLLSKGIPGFEFEKKMSTVVGGTANLDGYLERPDVYVFVEAKCREIYNHSASQKIKVNYRPVYVYLSEHMPNVFSCSMEELNNDKREMQVVFSCGDQEVAGFDIKQMICHMLAIAAFGLKKVTLDKELRFIYLLYDPKQLLLPDSIRRQVLTMYDQVRATVLRCELEEMFGHIVDYLVKEQGVSLKLDSVEQIKRSFRFVLVSQYDYHSVVNARGSLH